MSGRAEPGIGDEESARALLQRLMIPEEYIAILTYGQDRKLDSDSEVYFIVGMLKFFAYIYDRMLHTVTVAETGRSEIEATVILGEQNIRETIVEQMATLNGVIANMTRTMGYHAHQFSALTGEMKLLEKDLRATIRDADGAFRLYGELKDTGSSSTLSRLFYDRAKEALDRRVPFFEDSIRMLIAAESRKVLIAVSTSVALQILLIVFLR